MIDESVGPGRRAFDFGLFNLEPDIIDTLVIICTAIGKTDITSLSLERQPVGILKEKVRLRYLVALFQLADFLLIDRIKHDDLQELSSFDSANIVDARLALSPYAHFIDIQQDGITVHLRLYKEDIHLAVKMNDLFMEPVKKWWSSNWEWLYNSFSFFLTLHQPKPDILERRRSFPRPLKITCKALEIFIEEQFQPSNPSFPDRPPEVLPVPSPVDVGIIIALDDEFVELFNEFRDRFQAFPAGQTGRSYYQFEHSGTRGQHLYRCVATFAGEMGSTISGLMTQSFIHRWQPRTLVMLGSAATMSNIAFIGDIVVARQVDAYLDNSKAVPGPNPSSYMFMTSRQVYRCSNDLLNATRNFQFVYEELLQDWQQCCQRELERLVSKKQRDDFIASRLLRDQVHLITGDVASGPTVGSAQVFKDWLKTLNREYAALEMEAAGFMEAVNENAGGERTLVLRAISNCSDEHKQELDEVEEGVFRRYAIRNAIQLLWRFFDAGILPRSTSTS